MLRESTRCLSRHCNLHRLDDLYNFHIISNVCLCEKGNDFICAHCELTSSECPMSFQKILQIIIHKSFWHELHGILVIFFAKRNGICVPRELCSGWKFVSLILVILD